VTILADGDHDGIPDDWELSNNLDPANPADALLDADGDGSNNLQEYLTGTDPHMRESAFRIDDIRLGSNGLPMVRFTASSNKTYRVEARSGVNPGPWQNIFQLSASATNRPVEIADPLATNALRLYRLVTPARNQF
jgi:hypothetical protein